MLCLWFRLSFRFPPPLSAAGKRSASSPTEALPHLTRRQRRSVRDAALTARTPTASPLETERLPESPALFHAHRCPASVWRISTPGMSVAVLHPNDAPEQEGASKPSATRSPRS